MSSPGDADREGRCAVCDAVRPVTALALAGDGYLCGPCEADAEARDRLHRDASMVFARAGLLATGAIVLPLLYAFFSDGVLVTISEHAGLGMLTVLVTILGVDLLAIGWGAWTFGAGLDVGDSEVPVSEWRDRGVRTAGALVALIGLASLLGTAFFHASWMLTR